jgi:MFS family permease
MAHDPFLTLRNPEFRSFIGVRFFTTFALQMQFTALAWTTYEKTGSKLALGALGLCEFFPVILLALPVGHQVEKLEKKRVLLFALCVALFGSAVIAMLDMPALRDHLSLHAMIGGFFAMVALGGVVRAYFAPTFFSLIGGIVPKGQQTNSATWTASAFLAAQVAGPVAGGFLMHAFGSFGAQVGVLALLLVALFLATRLNRHPPVAHPESHLEAKETDRQKLLAGLRFVLRNPYMLGASLLDLLAVLFGDAVPLLPVYVKEVLGMDEQAYGILRAMPGIGSCVMMMTLARFPPRKNAGRILLTVVAAYGLGMLAFGALGVEGVKTHLTASALFTTTLIILLACGALDGVSVIIRQSIMQLHTPAHMRGRIGSVNSIFISSSNELGSFVSGTMAAAMGLVPAILTGGVFILTLTCGTAWLNPTLRKMDLEEKKD